MNTDIKKLKEIKLFINNNYIEDSKCFFRKSMRRETIAVLSNEPLESIALEEDINVDASWQEEVFRIIDNKNMKDPDVYKKAFITKQTFSKIRKDTNYHPDKDTAIKMCVGLELDERNSLKLLEKAGYTLSNSIKKDIVIKYFIRKKEFDIISINNALYDLNLDLIKC